MKRKHRKHLYVSICLLAAFALWTIAVCQLDVRAIGPNGTKVGFAALNRFLHQLTGVHMTLYTITDWLGLVPIGFGLCFAVFGLCQWIKRRHIENVDPNLLALGGFYIVVCAVYLLFETVVINYRPILINGFLEASYPSSTTLLVLCLMPTAAMQFHARMKRPACRRCAVWLIAAFCLFMVIGRLVSGVHWFSDIVGGILLSAGLVMLYRFVCGVMRR